MTSVASKSKMMNSNLAQQDPESPAQLARTLRRIKRRLLLEQCGVALPSALLSRPEALYRSSSQDSTDTTDSTFRIAMSKIATSMDRISVSSELSPAAPCVE